MSAYRDRSGNEYEPKAGDIVRERCGVFGVLVVNDRILVSWPKHQPDRAELPGGGTEVGESKDNTLLREIYEETGLRFAAIDKGSETSQLVHFYAEDDREFWDYAQTYVTLRNQTYRPYVFDGRRETPEGGFASWERLGDLTDSNMQIVHFEMLKTLNFI